MDIARSAQLMAPKPSSTQVGEELERDGDPPPARPLVAAVLRTDFGLKPCLDPLDSLEAHLEAQLLDRRANAVGAIVALTVLVLPLLAITMSSWPTMTVQPASPSPQRLVAR